MQRPSGSIKWQKKKKMEILEIDNEIYHHIVQ